MCIRSHCGSEIGFSFRFRDRLGKLGLTYPIEVLEDLRFSDMMAEQGKYTISPYNRPERENDKLAERH